MTNLIKSIALAALSTSIALSSSMLPAQAQAACQCTTYTANRAGLPQNYPHAGDWNDGYLQRNGYTQVGPQVGAIAVMERHFSGADRTYGHVGFVESLNNGQMVMRGANQGVGSNFFGESGCGNVRLTAFGANVNGNSAISFWVRGNVPPPPQNNGFNAVNFSGSINATGANVRSAPSANASIVGRFGGNARVNFDGWQFGDTVPDFWTKAPDARWYRIGPGRWVASAVVAGNAPGSRPMP
jgi:surface antigen